MFSAAIVDLEKSFQESIGSLGPRRSPEAPIESPDPLFARVSSLLAHCRLWPPGRPLSRQAVLAAREPAAHWRALPYRSRGFTPIGLRRIISIREELSSHTARCASKKVCRGVALMPLLDALDQTGCEPTENRRDRAVSVVSRGARYQAVLQLALTLQRSRSPWHVPLVALTRGADRTQASMERAGSAEASWRHGALPACSMLACVLSALLVSLSATSGTCHGERDRCKVSAN